MGHAIVVFCGIGLALVFDAVVLSAAGVLFELAAIVAPAARERQTGR